MEVLDQLDEDIDSPSNEDIQAALNETNEDDHSEMSMKNTPLKQSTVATFKKLSNVSSEFKDNYGLPTVLSV